MNPTSQPSPERPPRRSHLRVAGSTLAIAIGMFGFGYLMVPLYDIICEVTGLNGKTGRVSASEAVSGPANEGAQAADAAVREITVEFTASINGHGRWAFKPTVQTMTVTPGKLYQTSYYAENLSDQPQVGQATPSVTPFKAARYFNKTECFCFTRQEFEANSGRDMPLTFIIDEDIPINVDRVTLSYTFFKSPESAT